MKLAFFVFGLAAIVSAMAVEKRDGTCAIQPAGSGPAIRPDTPAAFRNSTIFSSAATSATIPKNYTLAFSNLKAATEESLYVGSTLLTKYSPSQCGSYCSQTAGCVAFNIYYVREPSMDSNAVGCPNPSSVTNIRCVLWGNKVSNVTATYQGQIRASFQVVVAGSNGYNKK